MTLQASTMKVVLICILSALSSSCAMRYKCDADASSIALAPPAGHNNDSQSERVAAYLPRSERKSGFEVARVDSIQEVPACGNPLIVTILTFGIVPSSIPIRFDVAVSGMDRGVSKTRRYWLAVEGRYSLWEALVPPSSDDKTIARELLNAVDRNQLTPKELISTVSKR